MSTYRTVHFRQATSVIDRAGRNSPLIRGLFLPCFRCFLESLYFLNFRNVREMNQPQLPTAPQAEQKSQPSLRITV